MVKTEVTFVHIELEAGINEVVVEEMLRLTKVSGDTAVNLALLLTANLLFPFKPAIPNVETIRKILKMPRCH